MGKKRAHPPNIPIALKGKMPSEEKCNDHNNNTLKCFYLSVDITPAVQKPRGVKLTCSRSQHKTANRSRPPGSQAGA